MSTAWYQGGDLTPSNQLRNPLKGRYRFENLDYLEASGPPGAVDEVKGIAQGKIHRQVVRSWGHPYRNLGRSDHDIGGEFLSLRAEVSGGSRYGIQRYYGGSPGYHTNWEGTLYASPEAKSVLSAAERTAELELSYLSSIVPQESTITMYSRGATAINRCAPTNPLVDLSTSMAELLREGLPSVPGRGGNIGGEYLNYQFGIAPLASDVRDLRRVMSQADALYEQYARNSGKQIRRRYNFDPEITTTSQVQTNRLPSVVPVMNEDGSTTTLAPSGAHVQPGTLSQITERTDKIWFSGAFTYYLPQKGWQRELDRLDRLYGLQPGVDTLYQLTPWSWLVDYFSNLGDVIENINAFSADGLVMPYGYVMAETKVITQSRLDFRAWDGTKFAPETVFDSVETTAKRRLPATPFGFGFLDEDLTPKQWSILAALGLSRR